MKETEERGTYIYHGDDLEDENSGEVDEMIQAFDPEDKKQLETPQ